jgi:hypothetical protein
MKLSHYTEHDRYLLYFAHYCIPSAPYFCSLKRPVALTARPNPPMLKDILTNITSFKKARFKQKILVEM